MIQNKPTHAVLDLMYTEEEGQEVFTGTCAECLQYIQDEALSGSIGVCTLQVVPIIKEEHK